MALIDPTIGIFFFSGWYSIWVFHGSRRSVVAIKSVSRRKSRSVKKYIFLAMPHSRVDLLRIVSS